MSEPELYTTREGYNETILHESLHYFTNHVILLLEDEDNKNHDYLLNDAEKKFYTNLKSQFDFFIQNVERPEQERWLNTYEFLTYIMTEQQHQKMAEEMKCDLVGAEVSEYSDKSKNLLNAVYNSLKNYIFENKDLANRIRDEYQK